MKEFRIAFEHLSDLYRSTAVNDGYFSPSMVGLSFRSNYNIWRYCSLALSLRHLYIISPHLRVAIIFFKRWSVYSYGIILHSQYIYRHNDRTRHNQTDTCCRYGHIFSLLMHQYCIYPVPLKYSLLSWNQCAQIAAIYDSLFHIYRAFHLLLKL